MIPGRVRSVGEKDDAPSAEVPDSEPEAAEPAEPDADVPAVQTA